LKALISNTNHSDYFLVLLVLTNNDYTIDCIKQVHALLPANWSEDMVELQGYVNIVNDIDNGNDYVNVILEYYMHEACLVLYLIYMYL